MELSECKDSKSGNPNPNPFLQFEQLTVLAIHWNLDAHFVSDDRQLLSNDGALDRLAIDSYIVVDIGTLAET